MSSEKNLSQNTINEHVCVGQNEVIQSIKTCQICGIMMDKKNGTKTFHRSIKYSSEYFRNDENRVFDQMYKKQAFNRTFNQNPPHIQFRAALIDYISKLADKLEYSKKTLHLCITIIDQVFSKCKIRQSDINLIAIVSLMIAAKMEENDAKIPLLTHIISKLNGKFKREDFTSCERTIFSGILNFNSNIVTSYDFAQKFLFKGILSGKEIGWNVIQNQHSMELIYFFEEIVQIFVDFALNHYEFYYFTAAAVAAASIACARKIFGTEEIWNDDMINLTRYSLQYIQQCSNLLIQLFAIEQEELLQRLFNKRNELKEKIKQNYFFQQSPITASQSQDVQNNDLQNLSAFSFQQDNFIIEELENEEENFGDSFDQSKLFLQESTQESLLRNNSQSQIQQIEKQSDSANHHDLQQTKQFLQIGLNKTNSIDNSKESL